jgi:hypothetical protein
LFSEVEMAMRVLNVEEIACVSGAATGGSTSFSLVTLGAAVTRVLTLLVLGLFGKSIIDLY